MIFLILIAALLLCVLVVFLPYSAGLTHVERESKKQRTQTKTKKVDYDGYVPPDELLRQQEEENERRGFKARASALKERINVTSDDVPIKIKLNQESVLKRRHERVVGDGDPNNYDYDLDELIDEETRGAAERLANEYYSKEKVGGDKEAMV